VSETAVPRYQQVKDWVVDRIGSGELRPDDRTPSENELVETLGVSRMTVNRALRELTAEGLLRRVQGLGTFVADARPQSELMELRNIADEIRGRGHQHRAEIRALAETRASATVASALGVPTGAAAFHSVIVHFENARAVQFEDRYVNPAAAPEYLDQDFTAITPNEYLMRVAPAPHVEHVVEAAIPPARILRALAMRPGEPCLLLHRRTALADRIVSRAWLWHPGARYRLGAAFDVDPLKENRP
jgi:GntR family transcriptional regulator, histidine utilization repressor